MPKYNLNKPEIFTFIMIKRDQIHFRWSRYVKSFLLFNHFETIWEIDADTRLPHMSSHCLDKDLSFLMEVENLITHVAKQPQICTIIQALA